jgi:hypothetical protein
MSTLLGPIVRMQLQRKPLKTPKVGYDPTPLLGVDEAFVGPGGITATVDGTRIVDANHVDRTNGDGRRALSMGFTDHYARMTGRFGAAPLGCAGENVVVSTDRRIHLDDLAGTVVIRTADGDLPLTGAFVAAPCLEFTSFLLGRDTVGSVEEIGEDRAFLHDGLRGYILGVKHLERESAVRVGDEVWVERS